MADNDLANRRKQNTNIVTLGSFQQEQTCIINSGYDRKRIRFALVMELTSVIISHVLTEQARKHGNSELTTYCKLPSE